jgi:hypothetical protein
MMTVKDHKLLLKKLKKQVYVLRKKEEQSRNKLRTALKKIRKLGRAYKSKLSSRVRLLHGKMAQTQASVYAKVAADLERKIQKSAEAKGKALTSAIVKVEKKHLAKLAKGIAKKGKQIGKVKKVTKKSLKVKKRSAPRKRRHVRRRRS